MSVASSTGSTLAFVPRNPVKTVTDIGAIGLFPTFFLLAQNDRHVSVSALVTTDLDDGTLRNLRSIARDSVPKVAAA